MAKATLIRYADDFVVMARHMSRRIRDFIEQKLEAWLGLKLNREKTRIVNLRRSQERLEFLGYQIGLAPVRDDRRRHYWRMEPSHKAMEREVDRIWQMTSRQQGWKPLPELIGELNRHLKDGRIIISLDNLAKPFSGSIATCGNGSISTCAAVVNGRGNRPRGKQPMGTSNSWD
jgi:Reverse transcriptase (RNA-dependent DNA polymerase)